MALKSYSAEVQINGFGSAYLGKALNSDVISMDFGETTNVQASRYTVFGLNAGSHLWDHLDATGQVVALGNRQESMSVTPTNWDVFVNWIFLNYETPVQGLRVKLGKQLIPTWMPAEYIYVRALQPYREIPGQVFDILPLSSFTGLSLVQEVDLGFARLSAQVYGGEGDGTGFASNFFADFQAENLLGVTLNLIGDGFKLHGNIARWYLNTSTLVNLNQKISPQLPPVQLTIPSGGQSNFISGNVGFSLEKYNFLLMAEYAVVSSPDAPVSPFDPSGQTRLFKGAQGAYALLGYHLGRLMPRYMFSISDWTQMGIPVYGKMAQHNIGANYQIGDQILAKLDLQIQSLFPGTPGYQILQNGPGNTGYGVTAGVDFIF